MGLRTRAHNIKVVTPAQAGVQLNNTRIQIKPARIGILNQFQFPLSLPFFQLFLSLDCGVHVFVQLIPNQMVYTITFRKSLYHIVIVLPHPSHEV